ncbi:MAG: hypothetical protein Q8L04_11830 [Ignavibacteria bacterium]|nr:hypothetical protein [Ignavibacteria bacterium]
MTRFKKILTVFLALVYITHVYSRLIHTPPIFLKFSFGTSQQISETNSSKSQNSFILNRRHLPLVKKIELGKLFSILFQDGFSRGKLDGNDVHEFPLIINYKSSVLLTLTNKAPPAIS